MGRQFRSARRSGSMTFTIPQVVTSSSTAIAIPNYGVTDITTWAVGDYVLDSPDAGSHKWIIGNSSVAINSTIWLSTGTSVKVGRSGDCTKIAIPNSTVASQFSIELLGINSTQWAILNLHPYTTVAATPQTTA